MVFKGEPKFDKPKFEHVDNFDPKDPHADPAAFLQQREHVVREKLIAVEAAKILRERVKECYIIEGVNHYAKCRHLVKEYMDTIQTVGWGRDTRILGSTVSKEDSES